MSRYQVSRAITAKIIELQERGYDLDFASMGMRTLRCIQSGNVLPISDVTISIEDIDYDDLSFGYRYIHLIDAGNGEKGILLADTLCAVTGSSLE